MHTNWREREKEFRDRILGVPQSQTLMKKSRHEEPAPKIPVPVTYCRRKRRELGLFNSFEAVIPTISGCGAEVVKHSSLPQVVDAPPTNQKMKNILPTDDGTIVPHQHRPEMRSKKKDVCEDIVTVEETGVYAGQITQDCPTKQRTRSRQRRKRKRVAEELSDSENSSPHYLADSDCRGLVKRRGSCNNAIIEQEGKLDSNTFQCHLENLWQSFSEERKNSFTHLDSLWFSMYSTPTSKERVLKWIRKKDIFSKRYVFVPIVQWCHWSLLIFCHFGESLESKSKTRTPCMLLLDSLHMMDPKRLEPGIRKFVMDIYRTEERGRNEKLLNKMPLLVPKVPQQRNGEECGLFVLYFINLFVESAPENFSRFVGYPYFMKKDWFTHERFDCFCRTLDSSSE